MTLNTFDYEEGDLTTAQSLADQWGIDLAQTTAMASLSAWGVALGPVTGNLGDINGDGTTAQSVGNVVLRQLPTAQVYDDPTVPNPGYVAQQSFSLHRWNGFSLPTSQIDAEGHETTFLYFPENDPDGDGTLTPDPTFNGQTIVLDGTSGANGGGFLQEINAPEQTQIQLAYDPLGHLVGRTDPRGFVTQIEWNALDQIVRKTNPRGYAVASIYDANDDLIEQQVDNVEPDIDPATGLPTGSETASPPILRRYRYDLLDNLIQEEVQADALTWLITRHRYDRASNRVLTLKPESVNQPENVVSVVIDELGQVFTETRGGVTAQFRALKANADIAETASIPDLPTASTKSRNPDANRFPIRWIDGEGHEVVQTFDGYGRVLSSSDPLGNLAQFVWDPSGNKVDAKIFGDDGAGNFSLLHHERALVDEQGRLYQRDRKLFSMVGGLSSQEGPLTPGDGWVTMRYQLDSEGKAVRTVDDNIHSAYAAYDGVHRLKQGSDDLGNSTTATYDKAGNLVQTSSIEVSSDGAIVEIYQGWNFYDNLNRPSATVDNIGNTKRFLHDSRNQLVFSSDAEGGGSLPLASLDLYGEFPGLSGPPVNDHGNTTHAVFDLGGRRVSTVKDLRVGGTGSGAIDPSQAGDGRITKNLSYDLNSRLIGETDDEGNTTTYQYDGLDRQTTTIFPDGSSHQILVLDRDDLPQQVQDANGSVFTQTFDVGHRLSSRQIATSLRGTTVQSFGYDGLGRIVQTFDNNDPADASDDESVTYGYDSLSQRLLEASGGYPFTSSFDGMGNLLTLVYPGGRTITQTFDPLNRLEGIFEGSPELASYDYQGPHRLLSRQLSGGLVSLDRQYDAGRRPISHRQQTAGGSLLAGFDYGYSRMSQKLHESRLHDGGKGRVWRYDSLYRVIEEKREVTDPAAESANPGSGGPIGGSTQLTLDGVNNTTALVENGVSYTNSVNELNEYTAYKGKTQAHDANGNRTQSGNWAYEYDALNRLVRASFQGQEVARYTYDAEGRRVQKIVASGQSLRFLYRGVDLLEERDRQTGALVRQYVQGGRINEVLQIRAFSQGSFVEFDYLTDLLGSTVGLTDASGNVVERVKYDLFGKPNFGPSGPIKHVALASKVGEAVPTFPSSSIGNPILFTGGYYDRESGLYYFRARYYDPGQGRFISRDPIGIWSDDLNLGNGQAYAANDPTNRWDPLGKETLENLQDTGTGEGGFLASWAGAMLSAAGFTTTSPAIAIFAALSLILSTGTFLTETIDLIKNGTANQNQVRYLNFGSYFGGIAKTVWEAEMAMDKAAKGVSLPDGTTVERNGDRITVTLPDNSTVSKVGEDGTVWGTTSSGDRFRIEADRFIESWLKDGNLVRMFPPGNFGVEGSFPPSVGQILSKVKL